MTRGMLITLLTLTSRVSPSAEPGSLDAPPDAAGRWIKGRFRYQQYDGERFDYGAGAMDSNDVERIFFAANELCSVFVGNSGHANL